MHIIDQLNENLSKDPYVMDSFEVVESPVGILVIITDITPSLNRITTLTYEETISGCALVSAKLIATYLKGIYHEIPQYAHVFIISENKMDTDTVTRICLLMHWASLDYLGDLDDANGENTYDEEMHEVSELLKKFENGYSDSSLRIGRSPANLGYWDVTWSTNTMCAVARFYQNTEMRLVSFKAYNEPHPEMRETKSPSEPTTKHPK